MQRVFNFSGGRTSALMTILSKPTENDIVLFCDTGREADGTYEFIDDFEKHEGIKVHRAVYTNRNAPCFVIHYPNIPIPGRYKLVTWNSIIDAIHNYY